jgi:HSP20 family protein
MKATAEVMKSEEKEAVPVREIRLEPAADVFRSENGVRVLVDLPGVAESDLDVQLHDGVLTIEGRAHRAENTLRVYSRSFRVDRRIDTEQIQANVAQGVLTLSLPFRAEAQPRKIAVNAS